MQNLKHRILVVLMSGLAFGCNSQQQQKQTTVLAVAAAADLTSAFQELTPAFEKANPGVTLKVTHGSSGNFYAQISNQAPFDLFLSADVDFPRKLSEQSLTDFDSYFEYAMGHLVLWAPNSSKLDIEKVGIKAVTDPSVKKISIANPRLAPYGRAAEAALKKAELYENIQAKLVLGDNVAQATQFVESGAAEIGIIALSLAISPAMKDKGKYVLVPQELYPKLRQGGVILKWCAEKDAAQRLRTYLLSDEGRAILKRYGFDSPEL